MKKKLLTLLIAICMILSMSMLAACGGSSGGGSGDSGDSGSGTETEQPADPAEKFAGEWKLAAAESQGVYMAGNFTELLELSDEGAGSVNLIINADKTGIMNLGDESANFTWEMKSDDVITITPEANVEAEEKVGETADVSYREDALWLTIPQDEGKEASLIYTKDGIFKDAKDFSMADAAAITSRDELIGKWTMSGLKMMGISMYGDAEALKNATSGEEIYIEFKEDGTTDMSGVAGTWEVTSDGATVNSRESSGTYTYPVKKLGDDIVVDCSALLNGTEYLVVLSK